MLLAVLSNVDNPLHTYTRTLRRQCTIPTRPGFFGEWEKAALTLSVWSDLRSKSTENTIQYRDGATALVGGHAGARTRRRNAVDEATRWVGVVPHRGWHTHGQALLVRLYCAFWNVTRCRMASIREQNDTC